MTWEERIPCFEGPGVLLCTTFGCGGEEEEWSLLTFQQSSPPRGLPRNILAHNLLNVDRQGQLQEYASVLLRDHERVLWPLADLPGNIVQGVFCAYTTEAQARAEHPAFLHRIQAALRDHTRLRS